MKLRLGRWWAYGLAVAGLAIPLGARAVATGTEAGPAELRVDDLKTPLGIDDVRPGFSWRLQDARQGARQTAYEVLVAWSAGELSRGNADVWDSGKVLSNASANVRYAGPALAPSKRYFWRVKLWDADSQPYDSSVTGWWETGLLQQAAWRGKWIGFETAEEDAVRHAPAAWIANPQAHQLDQEKPAQERIAYRQTIKLAKPIRSASLYATGKDTVSAWLNGAEVLSASPFPPWRQMPWKKFVRANGTEKLKQGLNTIAIETVNYITDPNAMGSDDIPPMIATLVVEYADGTIESFSSGTNWKSAIHPPQGWQQGGFDDSSWTPAVSFVRHSDPANAQPLGHPWIPDSVKALRHTFDAGSAVKSARLYATSLGVYEVFLNGKRVSGEVMAPGWTDYRENVKYQTFDVTADLVNGKNAIGVLLAPGWYETPLEWFQQPNNYGDTPPAFKAQLRIEHEDGSIDWVTTDPAWQAGMLDIEHSEIYDGETQDARRKQPGWDTAEFQGAGWAPVEPIAPKPMAIEAQDFQPIRVEQTLEPKTVSEPKPGVYVYDFGQNFSGVERVRVQGPAGTDVRLRFAEIVNADGTIYTDNLRTAKATDHFILSGNGVEEFTPQFTFHGFRYVELTGLPAGASTVPGKDAVSGLVFHTDAPFTAKLETGSELINKLWSNILWGQRSNFVGIPTDCPQRDERLGWMGDAEVFWRTAAYNMDLAAFSRKFSGDMRATQAGTPYYGIYSPGTVSRNAGWAPGWSDAGVIIPWTSWLQTGDTRIVDDNWQAMEKYLDAIEAKNEEGLWAHDSGIGYGDWLSPEGRTNQVLIATAYWAYDVTLMRQMAHATGRAQDEEKYARMFEKIRTAFQNKFVHADGFVAGADKEGSASDAKTADAKPFVGDTQTGYVLALHMNLVPDALRAAAAQKLADKIEANHGLLATGFLGTPYLLEELTKAGDAKLAYTLLLNTSYPSWGYMVDHGATTMWERWNGDTMKADPGMNSYNHYAYGAVADWIYRYAAGVDASPLDAGFHTVVLHPVFDAQLGKIAFDYDSSYGPIHSDWKVDGNTAVWHVVLPANTSGWMSADQAGQYRLEGQPLTESKLVKAVTQDGKNGYELPAGSYSFVATLP